METQQEMKTETKFGWDDVLSSKFVRLDVGKRKTLVAKNPQFQQVKKTFQGEEKLMWELSLDVVEEDNKECQKVLTTVSKRMMNVLKPLFENVPEDKEVRFSIKRIGKDTDTSYDAEKL